MPDSEGYGKAIKAARQTGWNRQDKDESENAALIASKNPNAVRRTLTSTPEGSPYQKPGILRTGGQSFASRVNKSSLVDRRGNIGMKDGSGCTLYPHPDKSGRQSTRTKAGRQRGTSTAAEEEKHKEDGRQRSKEVL